MGLPLRKAFQRETPQDFGKAPGQTEEIKTKFNKAKR